MQYVVDPRFIKRWALRWHEIRAKHGEIRANAWLRSFVPVECRNDVRVALRETTPPRRRT